MYHYGPQGCVHLPVSTARAKLRRRKNYIPVPVIDGVGIIGTEYPYQYSTDKSFRVGTGTVLSQKSGSVSWSKVKKPASAPAKNPGYGNAALK